MENIRLPAFYQHVSSWPTGAAELGAAVEKVSQLVGAPLVVLHVIEAGGKTAWKLNGATERAEPAGLEEYFRGKIKQAQGLFSDLSGGAPKLKTIKVEGDRLPWRSHPPLTNLSVINLSSDGRTQQAGKPVKGRLDFGWLLVGAPKQLTPGEEDLCVAAAQRLSALADTASLEGEVQLRNQFLSIASHELKTPLTSIYGVLQLQERVLRLGRNEPPEVMRERQESYLKMALRQTQRLNELIDGLLDVSRIQNGRFFAEPTDTDVATLVRESVNGRLSVIAQEAGVRLSLEAPQDLHAWVDPVRMEEVVTNLTMNAIRFSPEGGVIWIRTRADEGMMRISVRDQGPSVPPEDRERIFQPFERAQRTARFGGLGLGLFISRQIAQLHGGNVVLAESIPGKGNVFEATFPIRQRTTMSVAG